MARKVTIPGQNVPVQIGNAVNPDWYEKFKFLETLQPLSDVDFAAIDAAIAEKSNILRSQSVLNGAATLALSHIGKIIFAGNASPFNITIPPTSSVAWPTVDSDTLVQIDFINYGAGKVSFVAGSGVTILSKGSLKSIGQYSFASLVLNNASDVWYLGGDLIS